MSTTFWVRPPPRAWLRRSANCSEGSRTRRWPPGRSSGQQPTASLPAPGGRRQDGSHLHRRPIDGGGAQLSPAAAPRVRRRSSSGPPRRPRNWRRRRPPIGAELHCCSANIHQLGAKAALEGIQPLVRSRYTFPSGLPDPGRLAVPTRPVVVGAAPTHALRFQSQAAPSFNDPLRRAAVGSLIPLGQSTPRGALRARSAPGHVARAATEKPGSKPIAPKRPAQPASPRRPLSHSRTVAPDPDLALEPPVSCREKDAAPPAPDRGHAADQRPALREARRRRRHVGPSELRHGYFTSAAHRRSPRGFPFRKRCSGRAG
jgi:hypothetical protein